MGEAGPAIYEEVRRQVDGIIFDEPDQASPLPSGLSPAKTARRADLVTRRSQRYNTGMHTITRVVLLVGLLVVGVGCDQLTKPLAQDHLAGRSVLSSWGDLFRFEYAENPGAFLSMGQGLPHEGRTLLFQGGVGLFLTALAVYLMRASGLTVESFSAWALVLAGGVGNWLDRLWHDGRVIDFMNVGIGPLRTGIFNVADLCITVGLLWLMLDILRAPSRPLS